MIDPSGRDPDLTDGKEHQQAALAKLAAALADDPAYELLGEMETSGWGSGQWVRYTDHTGREHIMRVTVEKEIRPGG